MSIAHHPQGPLECTWVASRCRRRRRRQGSNLQIPLELRLLHLAFALVPDLAFPVPFALALVPGLRLVPLLEVCLAG